MSEPANENYFEKIEKRQKRQQELQRDITATQAKQKKKKSASLEPQNSKNDAPQINHPTIQTSERHLHEISNDCVAALKIENAREADPKFFLRGTEAVSIIRVKRQNNKLIVDPMSHDALKGELDRCSRFVRLKGKDLIPTSLAHEVVADIMSLPSIDLPLLSGVSGVPVFVSGGKLLMKNGFDAESGLFLDLNGLDGVGVNMLLEDAIQLILNELLFDFPFSNEYSKANAVAMTIQPFVRSLINGPTPLILVDAPAPGTGKGLILEATSAIYLGQPVEATSLPREETEIEKRITTLLLQATQFVRFDNIKKIKSESLSAVLTVPEWRGRILGVSKMPLLKNDVRLWTACGNNPDLSDEIARRVVPIRLDANSEHPELRTGFRHPDLLCWVLKHRAELVSACLSIVQVWINKGMPKGKATLGKFEAWAGVMGGILEVAGIKSFLTDRESLGSSDLQSTEWKSLCEEWFAKHGDLAVSATDILSLAKERNILLDVWAGRSALAGQQRMGHALWDHRGRIYAGFKIQPAGRDSSTGSLAYCLLVKRKTQETTETPLEDINRNGVQGVSIHTGVQTGDYGELEF